MVKSSVSLERFERDLKLLMGRILLDVDDEKVKTELEWLLWKLVELYRRGLVKINHSVMELLCAKHLLQKGYKVDVERRLNGVLTCDIYAVKGGGRLIVEIETGFVPPEHALDPSTYCRARIASKIARYSHYAEKFALGIPPYYIVSVPALFLKPPRHRRMEEIREIKVLCDLYYSNPPVSIEEVQNARLHTIYIIDVDRAAVWEVDPYIYAETFNLFPPQPSQKKGK